MTGKKWLRLLALALAVVILLPVGTVRAEEDELLARERQIYAYLTGQMGLNTAAACGILANIEVESGFSLSALGDSGTSYGLCQWHAGRYDALVTYCSARGRDYRSLIGQLEYLHFELRNNYASLYTKLRAVENTAQGAYQAGYMWCVDFERPADMEAKGAVRGDMAKNKYWLRYQTVNLPDTDTLDDFDNGTNQFSGYAFSPNVTEWRLDKESRETPGDSTGQKTGAVRRGRIKAYEPHHRPVEESPDAAIGVSVGLQFAVLGDGQDHRKRFLLEEEPQNVPAA